MQGRRPLDTMKKPKHFFTFSCKNTFPFGIDTDMLCYNILNMPLMMKNLRFPGHTLLTVSALTRLSIALGLLACLWAAIYWANTLA